MERWSHFSSRHVDARHVEIWLPPGFDDRKRYAVLYMHDGQMLFDDTTTWNGQAWQVDRVVAPLMASGQLRDTIIVGPWHNGKFRHAEYFPQAALAHLPPSEYQARLWQDHLLGQPRADAYLRFLVEELKPAIDAHYPTDPTRNSTFLMGSSMGGLISLYGLCEYPQVFGGAAALSTHWIGLHERNEDIPRALQTYLSHKLPPPESVRLYMDRGGMTLDALYDDAQDNIDIMMAHRGYRAPHVVSRVFEDAGHTERDWHARLDIPLRYLLGTDGPL